MKRFCLSFAAFAAILALIGSCYYHNEEDLYPESASCDTLNVTFSGKIVPLLANNCLTCHSNANAPTFANGIRLEDYDDVKIMATAISGAINHSASHLPMPKDRPKLKACLITQFDIWVRIGTPDN